jgi:hypothetical protein
MRVILSLVALVLSIGASAKIFPEGVTLDSSSCSFAPGRFSYRFLLNNEMIGQIMPGTCHYDPSEERMPDARYFVDFYMENKTDTFATKNEAMQWMTQVLGEYYKPVTITRWQNLRVQPPKVMLRYPAGWDYRLEKYRGIFKSDVQSENKLVLMRTDYRGKSEVMMIIRTPNTAKLTLRQVLEMSVQMNRAIDLRSNGTREVTIGGKTFTTSRNPFMIQMDQWHFWYADDQEIIYINYNLLKDEKIRFPNVMNDIVQSISW